MKNKVIITFYDVENNISEENLWIESHGNNLYQIKNIPFFAPNIAYDDIIKVEDDDGVLYFDELVETSENSTIQIVFFKDEFVKSMIREIESFGCYWEGMYEQKILAIDVPFNIKYDKIKEYLNTLFDANILDYKEACLSKVHSQTN
ncbi:DUF4265 domain-containing protein [Chishuiella sp.]|uniref:DUF4265 domain-containing protein n=1 Tax=Chishuiella sp. TaxID=1969467 RepID=UPI0028A7BDB6|nr:DUF4265 domain-containing protein [Chishuiella sp.]